jgi:hypothetical protein
MSKSKKPIAAGSRTRALAAPGPVPTPRAAAGPVDQKFNPLRAIDTDLAHIFDDFSAGTPSGVDHELANGLALKAGRIKVTNVVMRDSNNPLSAVILSDDETAYLPGSPTGVTGSGAGGTQAPVTWNFDWSAVGPIGAAFLRLTEVTPDRSPGSEQTISLSFHDDLNTDPVLIGITGSPIGL